MSSTGVSHVHEKQDQDHGRDARETHGQDARATLPQALGIVAQDVREQALSAAKGANDFAGLFIGLSFFVIASALLLTALIFSMGITQRYEQIGILKATGFTAGTIRRLLMAEGGVLAIGGAALGVLLGVAYAWLILRGLSTIWSGAVGQAQIDLHIPPFSLAGGAALAATAAFASMFFSLRRAAARSANQLLSKDQPLRRPRRWWGYLLFALPLLGPAALFLAGAADGTDGGISSLAPGALVLCLSAALIADAWFEHPAKRSAKRFSLRHLIGRYLLRRRGRNVGTILLLACAVFLIATISVFHQRPDRQGTGGFAFLGKTAVDIPNDKAALPSDALPPWIIMPGLPRVVPLRVYEGDDASCLNLNAPRQPRIMGVDPSHMALRRVRQVGFANGWQMLDEDRGADVVPAVADAATITYALHSAVGRTIAVAGKDGRTVKLLLVGAMGNTILQGSLIISERQFVRHFDGGYRTFLVSAAPGEHASVPDALTEEYGDYGLELQSTEELLAQLNTVQNTYLAIFQALGGLGLVLGSAGLGLVLMRNVFERRCELAILRAVGFTRRRIVSMVLIEHMALLGIGLITGLAAAAAVIMPQSGFVAAYVPVALLSAVLGGVVLVGAASTLMAARLALRGRLIDALREE